MRAPFWLLAAALALAPTGCRRAPTPVLEPTSAPTPGAEVSVAGWPSATPPPSSTPGVAAPPPGDDRGPLTPADAAARQAVIDAIDAGRYDLALERLQPLLARYPDNLVVAALAAAAHVGLEASGQTNAQKSAQVDLEGRTPLRLARPPFAYTLRRPAPGPSGRAPRLRKRSEARNQITDDAAWFQRNQVALPTLEVPNPNRGRAGQVPPEIPTTYAGNILVKAIARGDHTILLYGPDYSGGRYLAVLGPNLEILALLDFDAYLWPPSFPESERQFVDEPIHWAEVVDGVLYVSNGHRTYARSSRGQNAYITAIDLQSGELLWRSQPLIANAANFVIRGGAILSGYGFTAEPDFLFVLDRASGRVLSKVKVASGPDYLIEKDGDLLVRTYDHDYVFAIE